MFFVSLKMKRLFLIRSSQILLLVNNGSEACDRIVRYAVVSLRFVTGKGHRLLPLPVNLNLFQSLHHYYTPSLPPDISPSLTRSHQPKNQPEHPTHAPHPNTPTQHPPTGSLALWLTHSLTQRIYQSPDCSGE